jgi:hypothetical protein
LKKNDFPIILNLEPKLDVSAFGFPFKSKGVQGSKLETFSENAN